MPEPGSDGEQLCVFHEFISVRDFPGFKDPLPWMCGDNGVLGAEVMQGLSCWKAVAEASRMLFRDRRIVPTTEVPCDQSIAPERRFVQTRQQ